MAVSVSFYNRFKEFSMDGTMDMDDTTAGTFTTELVNTNYTFSAAHSARSEWSSNALSSGNGYTSPGQDMTSVTWVKSGSTLTWDAADMSWTASGGSIGPAKHGIVYDDTTTTATEIDSPIIDVNFGQEETAGSGTDFKITWAGTGIFTLT